MSGQQLTDYLQSNSYFHALSDAMIWRCQHGINLQHMASFCAPLKPQSEPQLCPPMLEY